MNIKKPVLIILIGLIIVIPTQTKAFLGIADVSFSFDAANFGQNTTSAASGAVSATHDIKEVVKFSWEKVLAQLAARTALNMSQQIINWGSTGFKGDPFYVRDMGSFMKSIADEQVTTFINSSVGGSPFGQQLSETLIQAYTTGSAPQFNLDQYVDDPLAFADDFTAGGWRGWLAINANSGNNPLGYTLESSRYLSNQINNAVQNQKQELGFNNGFLSMKKCVEYGSPITQDQIDDGMGEQPPTYETVDDGSEPVTDEFNPGGAEITLGEGTSVTDTQTGVGDSTGEFTSTEPSCMRWETTTPGKLINEQLNKAVLSPLETAIKKNTQGGIGDALISLAAGVISQGINNLVGSAIEGGSDTGGPGSNSAFGTTVIGGTLDWNTGTGTVAILEDPGNPGNISGDLSDSIKHTSEELDYLEQQRSLIAGYPLKELSLDMCLPGPDLKYATRLNETFQVVTRKLQNKAQKDTDNGDEASDAIRRLTSDMDSELLYIKQAMIEENIPSAPLIMDRIGESPKYFQTYTQLQDKIASKIRVLAILQEIENTIKTYPSTLVNGVLTPPEAQDWENLQRLYSSIQPQIGSEDSRNDAQGDLEIYKKDDFRSFSTANPDSLQTKCINERATHPDIEKRDNLIAQNQKLFCRFQQEVLVPANGSTEVNASNTGFLGFSGNNYTIYNPTNIDLIYPGDWTWDQEPFKNDKVDINCADFYRSYLGDYSTDSFSN